MHREGLGDGRDVGNPLLPQQEVHHEARQHCRGPQQVADQQVTNHDEHGSVQVLVYGNDGHHHTVPQQHQQVVDESQEEEERAVTWRHVEALQLEHDRLFERFYHCSIIHPKQQETFQSQTPENLCPDACVLLQNS